MKHIIEMIGPSGSGKTTTLNSALSLMKGYWKTKKDLKRANLWNTDNNLAFNNIYSKLYRDKVENLANLPIRDRIHITKYLIRVIEVDITLINESINTIVDEGIFHNFSEEAMKVCTHPEWSDFFQNRHFVSIEVTTDTLLSQVLGRKKKGWQIPKPTSLSLK